MSERQGVVGDAEAAVQRPGRRVRASLAAASTLWLAATATAVWTARSSAATDAGQAGHPLHAGHGAGGPFVVRVVAWSTMTLAMMLPTSVPMLLSLADVLAARRRASHAAVRSAGEAEWWAFLGAYVVIWSVTSVVFASVQAALGRLHVLDADGDGRASLVTAVTLVAAGAYQFTPLKARCLTGCTRPITFLIASWRDGVAGAWSMGLRHGATCVGCCWALMALSIVGGIHSLGFMAVATVVMVVEKLPSIGETVRVPLGIVLVLVGVAAAVAAIA